MMLHERDLGGVEKSGVNAASRDSQGWTTACELLREGAGELVFDDRFRQLDLALSRTRALLKAVCFLLDDHPDEIDHYELMGIVEIARDTLLSVGDNPLEFMEDFASGARQVVYDQVQRAAGLSSVLQTMPPPSQAEFKDVLTQAIKDALEKEGVLVASGKPKRAGKTAVKGNA